jgi:hypothetical protein
VLALLIVAGAALRLWLLAEWRPAFLGYSDTRVYLTDSADHFFGDPLRAVGYPVFLAGLRGLSSNLTFTIVVQHILGMASALCLYFGTRRLGLRRWAALIPAGVVLLHGPTIWLEHTVLTECLFTFLVCAGFFVASLAVGRTGWAWSIVPAAAAGLVVGAAGAVRPAGIVLLPLLAAWAVWALPGAARQRVLAGLAVLGAGAGLLGANLLWAHSETGAYAFMRHSYYAPYGRVATFVDCNRFTPPPDTEPLCPTTPVRDRPGASYWVFSADSPLVNAYGGVSEDVQPDYAAHRVGAFDRAAVLGQPVDYLRAVGRDLVRVVDPNFPSNPNRAIGNGGSGSPPEVYQSHLMGTNSWSRQNEAGTVGVVAELYSTRGMLRSDLDGLRSYEAATRLIGAPMVLLLLLAIAGPFAASGASRRSAALFSVSAIALIVAPMAAHTYDWRYVVVVYGPLSAAAAFGVQGLSDRVRRARAKTRNPTPAAPAHR